MWNPCVTYERELPDCPPPSHWCPASALRRIEPEVVLMPRQNRQTSVGISNRETPAEEARERATFPPLDPGSPPPQDAGGSVGEPATRRRDGHTSHKAGSRSVAQKEAGSRYPDRSMPAARKVSGAHGEEPAGPGERDRRGSLHQSRTARAPARRAR
jgi:hypothetical protein